jgi:hypothetical protein
MDNVASRALFSIDFHANHSTLAHLSIKTNNEQNKVLNLWGV